MKRALQGIGAAILCLAPSCWADPLDHWHWRGPVVQTNDFSAVTYGNGTFIAVGSNSQGPNGAGAILTSADLVSWTPQQVPASASALNGITYGGGRFVAVGDSGTFGTLLTSTNGTAWTTNGVEISQRLNAVAYGNGTFVAVGWAETIFTSADGLTWQPGSLSNTNVPISPAALFGVAFGNGKFVAVGDSGAILTSSDGIRWSFQSWTNGATIYDVTYGNGVFVAVGNSGVLTSTNGLNWTAQASTVLPSFGLQSVAYGNGVFVAWADVAPEFAGFVSTDGVTWAQVQVGSVGGGFGLGHVSFGNGTFVAVAGNTMITSTDGRQWATRTTGPGMFAAIASGPDLDAVVYGSNTFVAVGGGSGPALPGPSTILKSTDAITWLNESPVVTNGMFASPSLRGVAYGNNTFVAVADLGNILTSSDGTSWTNRGLINSNMPPYPALNGVTYGNNGFLAVGGIAGTTFTSSASTNGIVWSTNSLNGSNSPPSGTANGVAYGTNLFVAVGAFTQFSATGLPTTGPVLTSYDGSTWSLRGVNSSNLPPMLTLKSIAYGNGTFVAVGGSGAIVTSTDGLTWNLQTNTPLTSMMPGPPSLNGVAFAFGNFAAVGDNGTIITSPDGVTWTWRFSGLSQNAMLQNLLGIAPGNGTFLAVGNNGIILQSDPLNVPPIIGEPPQSGNAVAGTFTSLTVAGDGPEPFSYQWFKNGSPIPGATNATLGFGAVQPTDAGSYTVNVSNAYGTVTSSTANLTVEAPGSLDAWHWRNPLPQGNALGRVLFANGQFVAVGAHGAVVTSTDGATWTDHITSSIRNAFGLTYGNGRFVVVGDGGPLMTSPDGAGWTNLDSSRPEKFSDVAYGNGQFVAVGNALDPVTGLRGNALVSSSTDGTQWTNLNLGGTNLLLNAIAYGNGLFVIAGATVFSSMPGFSTEQAVLLSSTDGRSWTTRWTNDPTLPVGGLSTITYANGRFVAVGPAGGLGFLGPVLTSVDGLTWASAPPALPPWFIGISTSAIAFGNGSFVAVGSLTEGLPFSQLAVTTSSDGLNWTNLNQNLGPIPQSLASFPYGGGLNGVAFGNGVFVTVGNAGEIYSSTNSTNWVRGDQQVTDPVLDDQLFGIAQGNGTVVAVGAVAGNAAVPASGVTFTSTNDLAWTRSAPGTNNLLPVVHEITYGNGKFVAVGDNGLVLTASDGLNWTIPASLTNASLFDVTYGNGLFVAIGKPETVFTSVDGTNWTSPYAGTNGFLNSICFGNGIFVAVGSLFRPAAPAGQVAEILTSSDGYSWTQQPSALTNFLSHVRFANGTFIAVGDNGTILTSSDGTSWTPRDSGTTSPLYGIAYGNGVVAVSGGTFSDSFDPNNGPQSVLLTSTDLVTWTQRNARQSGILGDVVYANGTFIAVGDSGAILQSDPISPRPPVVVQAPQTQTVVAGGTLNLTVVAFGSSPLAYQWLKNGTAIAGATNAVLTFAALGLSDAGSYTVTVSNPQGSATSQAAVLTVNPAPPPSIATQPQSQSVSLGSVAIFSVAATGTSPLQYQWMKDGANLAGATNSVLALFDVQPANAGSYAVTVSNAGTVITSSAAVLKVELPGPLDAWHWRNPLPQGNGLGRVVFANGQFVAVGAHGAVVTSSDGVTWTDRITGSTKNLNGVAYGNGRLVGVGDGGPVMISADGIHWGGVSPAPATNSFVTNFYVVTYGEGQFVAFGSAFDLTTGRGGAIFSTSTNGIQWSTRSLQTNVFVNSALYADGLFVAVGGTNTFGPQTPGVILTSVDAINWVSRSVTSTVAFTGITYGNGRFVAVGSVAAGSGSAGVTSIDGIIWEPINLASSNRFSAMDVAYGNGLFIAIGGDVDPSAGPQDAVATSTDGFTWTTQNLGTPGSLLASYGLASIAYGNSVFACTDGAGALFTSADGIHWSRRDRGVTDPLGSIVQGNGTLVAVGGMYGSRGTILTSTDGLNWADHSPASTNALYDVTYGNGSFVAVGDYGTVLTSTDGLNWATQNFPTNLPFLGPLIGVTYGNGLYVAVEGPETIFTSADAVHWTNRFTGTNQNAYLNGVGFGNGVFVAVGGAFNGAAEVLISPDGTKWTRQASPSTNSLGRVAFANNGFVAVGVNGTILTSTDGTNWSTRNSGTTAQLNSVAYGNGVFAASGVSYYDSAGMFTGPQSMLLTSTDLVTWAEHDARAAGSLGSIVYANGSFMAVGDSGGILQSDPLSTTAPTIITQPQDQTAPLGTTVTFSVIAGGTTPLGYQWYANGLPIARGTDAVLVIPNVGASDSGNYQVVVSNAVASVASSVARLSVTAAAAPVIIGQPQNLSAASGARVTFTVAATGSPPFQYQWTRNGANVAGATNSFLALVNVQVTDAGNYAVTIKNPGGSISSSPATLTVYPPPGSVDPLFHPTPGLVPVVPTGGLASPYAVLAIAPQPDGKVVIGGSFTNVDGVPRNNIARLNGDGSIDASFDPGSGIMGVPVGWSATLPLVRALALQTDGKIIAGGVFTNVNGVARNSLVRFNSNGSVDAGFQASVGVSSASSFWAGILSLVLQNDGKVLVGGTFTFTNVDSTPRYGLARLNSDGSLDVNFDPDLGTNASVFAVALQADNRVLIGGTFTSVNGISRSYITRLQADGSLDASFDATNAVSAAVDLIAIQADGKILAVSWPGPVRLNTDGSLDPSFTPPPALTHSPPVSEGDVALGMAVQPDGDIFMGGTTTSPLPTGLPGLLFGFHRDGSEDPDFHTGTGADGPIDTLALATNGDLWIGGSFTTFNGTPRSGIARLYAGVSLPEPQLFSPAFYGGVFSFSLSTVAGESYNVEFKNALADSAWTPLLSLDGTGAPMTVSDFTASGPQRSYRVTQTSHLFAPAAIGGETFTFQVDTASRPDAIGSSFVTTYSDTTYSFPARGVYPAESGTYVYTKTDDDTATAVSAATNAPVAGLQRTISIYFQTPASGTFAYTATGGGLPDENGSGRFLIGPPLDCVCIIPPFPPPTGTGGGGVGGHG